MRVLRNDLINCIQAGKFTGREFRSGTEVSCPKMFSVACQKSSGFARILPAFRLKLLMDNFGGGGGRCRYPPPIVPWPVRLCKLFIWLNIWLDNIDNATTTINSTAIYDIRALLHKNQKSNVSPKNQTQVRKIKRKSKKSNVTLRLIFSLLHKKLCLISNINIKRKSPKSNVTLCLD